MVPAQRNYNMTDAELAVFTSNLVVFMTRDQTQFTTRGVTAAMVTALETLGNAFEILPADSYYLAEYMAAAESKNNHRELCTVKLRAIIGYVKIKWGVNATQVRKFGASNMTRQDDKKFLMTCRLGVTIATEYLTDLTPVGLTQAMIDDLEDTAQLMEDDLNDIASAVATRDIKTVERINKGNELYDYVSRYCDVGKIIWEDVDTAKYNDYVIYPTSYTGLPKPQNLVAEFLADTPPVINLHWDAVTGATNYDLYSCIVDLYAPSGEYTLSDNVLTTVTTFAPIVNKRNYFKIKAKNATLTSAFSDEAWADCEV